MRTVTGSTGLGSNVEGIRPFGRAGRLAGAGCVNNDQGSPRRWLRGQVQGLAVFVQNRPRASAAPVERKNAGGGRGHRHLQEGRSTALVVNLQPCGGLAGNRERHYRNGLARLDVDQRRGHGVEVDSRARQFGRDLARAVELKQARVWGPRLLPKTATISPGATAPDA